jgi:DNA-binding NarL/FixJ family response regulator
VPHRGGAAQSAGYNQGRVKILLVSSDPNFREALAVMARGVKRSISEEPEFIGARDGIRGVAAAWRHRPEVVIADEIASRAGAFALTRELKGAVPPFEGRIVIILDRKQDEWLARWSGADAWFVKPVNPFELADTITDFLTTKEAV